VNVIEVFFGVEVTDMDRAKAFYANALGATVAFTSPGWSSLHIAGVRIGLALNPMHAAGRIGLHFAVSDLAVARSAVERAGGRIGEAVQVAPGVIVADVTDTEGNTFTITPREGSSR
jgi:predicted enzyme related to lactoylglutathione lyase